MKLNTQVYLTTLEVDPHMHKSQCAPKTLIILFKKLATTILYNDPTHQNEENAFIK